MIPKRHNETLGIGQTCAVSRLSLIPAAAEYSDTICRRSGLKDCCDREVNIRLIQRKKNAHSSSSARRAAFALFFMTLMSCPGLHLAKTGWRSILYIPQPNIMRNSMRLLLAGLINTDNLSPLTGARPFLVMTVYSIHGNKKDNSAKLEAQLAYWRVLYR